MKKRFVLKYKGIVFLLVCACGILSAQDFPKNCFRAPLDIPMYLSGNFGELRSNHYHSGVDIKTQGRTGHKIYATADGFVSRVKVSPYGYGLAIYIDHPNGYTTVYGHLKSFSSKIDKVVKSYQYKKESFAIDESLPRDLISVKKGEVIALSGNSGSSGGPHLHYEIRETTSEFPTNPLLYGLNIKDDVNPVMRALLVYDLEGETQELYALQREGCAYQLKDNAMPKVSGKVGFGLDVRDYMTGTHNYYGIYKLRLYVDEFLQHSFTFDKFSFAESRYINAHIDYPFFKKRKRRVHRLYQLPNQQESFTHFANNGIVFNDNKQHLVRIEIADAYGNNSFLTFKVQAEEMSSQTTIVKEKYAWNTENYVSNDNFFVKVPQGTFYQDITKKPIATKQCVRKDSYAPLYEFLGESVPLHKRISVGVRPYKLPKNLRDKAFLARESKNKYSFVGKKWDGEFLTAKTKVLGRFTVLVDTVSPKIELWKGSSFKVTGKLRYKITDNLSGISSFRGEIDGKWELFEYDPKRRILWHMLSSKRIAKGKKHHLKLQVKDACGNIATRKVSFTW